MGDEGQRADDGSASGVLRVLGTGAVLLLLFDRSLRFKLGAIAGTVLRPVIGFGGHDVALTLFLAALITALARAGVRYWLVDGLENARLQARMKAYQEELKAAREAEDEERVDALLDAQPRLMELQKRLSGSQFKVMGATMIAVIPMFGWLWTFLHGLQDPVIQGPWGLVHLMRPAPIVSFMPTWILIYSLFSIPLGQLSQKGLRALDYAGRIDPSA